MSITTYAELQSALTNWLGGRTDLTTYYPDWITVFEAYAARRLRVRPMETSTTLTPSSGIASLPNGYLGWRSVTWNGTPARALEYVNPQYMTANWPTSPSGNPEVFTIYGTSLKVMPLSDTTLTFLYYAKNTAVSSSLNWLFTNYPDAYLFGALAESGGFTQDTDSLSLWKQRRDEVMSEVAALNFREPGAGMAIRMMNATP